MVGARKVTLADVAARAGVSATTASYILNGRSAEMRISTDAECRVREAVADLGYRPNRNARSLRTATTKTIGVITDFVASGMFSSRLIAGANAAARARDHLLVIGETEGDPEVERLLVEEMVDRQVDGILYVTRTTVRIPVPTHLPVGRTVLLNCSDVDGELPSVLPDEEEGGRTAARTLLAAGLREGVYVVGEDPTPQAVAGIQRLAGIREEFTASGVALGGVLSCDWSVEDAYEAVHAWLGRGHRPRGLVCLNDRIAMGVYQALSAHGLAVPGDVSVISFDGSELATWLRPRVTSVELPFVEMGGLAVELLLDPARTPGTQSLVAMPLVPGASIGRAAAVSRA
ncbi:MAG: LacI family DNA-binding transcriptional regulator [Nocardioides sp.]